MRKKWEDGRRPASREEISLQLEIDGLGIRILEALAEGLIDILDRAAGDTDIEADTDDEPAQSPVGPVNQNLWAFGGQNDAKPLARRARRLARPRQHTPKSP
jgi:hypothetical protein